MLKFSAELEKSTLVTTYNDMKAGDVFSWPVFESSSNRAVGLKLRTGFVWIHSVGIRNLFVVNSTGDGDVHGLCADMEVCYEGKLKIKFGD